MGEANIIEHLKSSENFLLLLKLNCLLEILSSPNVKRTTAYYTSSPKYGTLRGHSPNIKRLSIIEETNSLSNDVSTMLSLQDSQNLQKIEMQRKVSENQKRMTPSY